MKIILLKDVPKTGRKGDIVTASDGYSRNFLIPRGFARIATDSIIKENDLKKKKEIETASKKSAEIKDVVKMLDGNIFKFEVKTGKNNEVFESVHGEDIQKAVFDYIKKNLKQNVIEIEDISANTKPIKELGKHKVFAKIGKGDMSKSIGIEIEVVGK